ncbi:MAG TPA: hypothetical protein VK427_04460, partial [Kofleriaceae bacterium]|nr:hypothetical protein [Kofleriaceae bacterium]
EATVVVTIDELGGARLWTALDGSAEPRVVDLPVARSLAVGPLGTGYVIALTDSVGALIVQLVDAGGVTRQRVTLPIEPAFAGVARASERGVLAWRTDQRIVAIAAETGKVTGELAAEPGQRIVALTANANRAVAVIEANSPPTRRARWVTLSPRLAWGAFVDGSDELGTNVTLSPSGKRIASLADLAMFGPSAVVLDASGKLVASAPAAGATGIALPDDEHLALGFPSGVQWVDLTTGHARRAPGSRVPTQIPDVSTIGIAGHGRAVGALDGDLVIATPTKTEFLGYGLASPVVATPGPKGSLLIGLGKMFALLDDNLAAVPPPDFRLPWGSTIADVRWLAGADWLVQSYLPDAVTGVMLVDMMLVDTATKRQRDVHAAMSTINKVAHAASTGLVTLSLGDKTEVLHHTPGQLRTVATLPGSTRFSRARTELVPVDPALAGGTQVVVVHVKDRLMLRWAKDATRLEAAPGLTVDGSVASVDATGRVYVWRHQDGALGLAMYRHGKLLGQLPSDAPVTLWPDPRGTRVLQVSATSSTLVGVDGTIIWSQPVLGGVHEAFWLDNDTLALVGPAGIARVNAASGTVEAARCGWRFGLSAQKHPQTSRIEPICTQLQ